MKQILSLILCGFLLLALCACSLARSRDAQTEPAPETALPPTAETPKKDFDSQIREILAGTGSFFSLENRIYMTLEEYCVSGSIPVEFTKAAKLDMDGDGKEEMLLWLASTREDFNDLGEPFHFGTLILTRGKDRVEGRFLSYHDLSALKADGTFRWYGKHESLGIAALAGWERKLLAAVEKADYSSPENTMVYTVDRAAFSLDESLSEEEAYRRANEIQDAKEDVQWMDFPLQQFENDFDQAPRTADSKSIDFRYLFRGFTPVLSEDLESFEAFSQIGLKVILEEEDWALYMEQFCPGIPYFESCDFSKECLLASVAMGARPNYTQGSRLISLKSEDGYFVFEYDDSSTDCIALNSGGLTQFYVEVLIISKSDLPSHADELIYHN